MIIEMYGFILVLDLLMKLCSLSSPKRKTEIMAIKIWFPSLLKHTCSLNLSSFTLPIACLTAAKCLKMNMAKNIGKYLKEVKLVL